MDNLSRIIGDLESSALDMEVLRFFSQNPFSQETAKGLAIRLGRDVRAVVESLGRLEEANVLQRRGEGTTAVYRYSCAGSSRGRPVERP